MDYQVIDFGVICLMGTQALGLEGYWDYGFVGFDWDVKRVLFSYAICRLFVEVKTRP